MPEEINIGAERDEGGEHMPPFSEWPAFVRVIVFTSVISATIYVISMISWATFRIMPELTGFIVALFIGGGIMELGYEYVHRKDKKG